MDTAEHVVDTAEHTLDTADYSIDSRTTDRPVASRR